MCLIRNMLGARKNPTEMLKLGHRLALLEGYLQQSLKARIVQTLLNS